MRTEDEVLKDLSAINKTIREAEEKRAKIIEELMALPYDNPAIRPTTVRTRKDKGWLWKNIQ